jgi:hypothetical protein
MSELPELPTREAIAAELTTVARQGLKARRLHLKLDSLGALAQLEGVKSRPPEERAEAIRDVVAEGVESLPRDGTRDALEALLGIGMTAEAPHASRRSAAMQALGLDPTVSSEHSFRKTREKELLWDLAGAISGIGESYRQRRVTGGIQRIETGEERDAAGPAATRARTTGPARTAALTAASILVALVLIGVSLVVWQRIHSSALEFFYAGGGERHAPCETRREGSTALGKEWPNRAANPCLQRVWLYRDGGEKGPTLCLSPDTVTGRFHRIWTSFRIVANRNSCPA